MRFRIEYPPNFGKLYGLNAIYAGKHWSARQKDSVYWHTIVRKALKNAGIKKGAYKHPVSITFWWDDRLDCSNHAYASKMIEDALKGYLIVDDNKKWVKRITHEFHTGKCILVEIKALK